MVADEELFLEWQKGSVGAFETLVRRHHAPLVAHIYRLVNDAHLAEDLAQETFVRLVHYANNYQYPRPFLPWFYSIARRIVLNQQKSAYHRYVEIGTGEMERLYDDLNPVEWLDRWERHHGLQKSLERLPLEYREVLSLRFGQELSVKDVAEILGVPVGTVKSRTFTALRLLRAELEREERPPVDIKGDQLHG